MMFMVLPMWLGYIWVEALEIKGRLNQVLHAWVLGFTMMLAVGQLVLVPLVAMQQTLTTAVWIWKMCLQILAAVSFLVFLKRQKERGILAFGKASAGKHREEPAEVSAGSSGEKAADGGHIWLWVLGVLAVVLILMQAYIPARYQHSDDDDSRFIAEEVSAIVHDTMYQESTIGADFLYWNEGEVRKDLTSPWAMFVAMSSKISGIAPAVLSHSYLPFFLTILCYAVYALIGKKLLRDDWEKTFLFLIFLSVLHLFGYTSTHTLASMLLLRIWQGKAVCASFMLPLFFYLFYEIMQKDYKRGWLGLLYVASIGACLLSGIGIVTAPIMLLIYGFLDFCYCRRWRKTLAIWMAAVPCAIFLGYYLM